MSAPMPGQRAAQRPLRAAITSQAAVGRAAANQSAMSGAVILNVHGTWRQVVGDGLENYEFGSSDNPEGE